MGRTAWIVAAAFVFVGLLCLLAASGVWLGGPMGMMDGAMVAMRPVAILFVLVLLLAALALILYLARALTSGCAQERHCAHCGRPLLPDWRVCPYCGERMRERDDG